MSQPAGRAPAPPPLDRIQDFVNSVDLLDGQDENLTDPATTAEWLRTNAFTPERIDITTQQFADLVNVREALRAFCHKSRQPQYSIDEAATILSAAALRSGLVVDFAEAGRLRSLADGVDAIVGTMLSVLQAGLIDSSWQRLKACQGCGWVFYDESRSRGGRWCSMAICGNRSKNRTHRQRSRSE